MELEDGIKRINGTVEVEIQGFFTERFINLCKINNIKIWNIKNIVNGIVRFNIALKDFKKLKVIARKTKCNIKIISKKGLYFKFFKYRKRRLAFLLILVFILISIVSTTFIWDIDISGNTYISQEKIYDALKESGLYVGKNKIGIKTKKIINSLRVNLSDIAWAGIEIDGTHAHVKIVEKTKLPDSAINENSIGDIIANKSGIIEKITVENGTSILNVGEYVEEGRILIEGKIYSEFLETKDVTAKGTVMLKTQYEYKNQYYYNVQEKEYTGKSKYSIGIGINDKENYINYLDKSLNYDIIKNSKDINLFGNNISFILYRFDIYNLKDKLLTKYQILERANIDCENYIKDEILPNTKNGELLDKNLVIEQEDNNKINIKFEINILEEVGYFRERT